VPTPRLTRIESCRSGSGRAPRTYGIGRRCACGTVLSRYNRDTICQGCKAAKEHAKEGIIMANGVSQETVDKVRELLLAGGGEPVKRPDGISRQTWSNAIRRLREQGLQVDTRTGYHGGSRLRPESPQSDGNGSKATDTSRATPTRPAAVQAAERASDEAQGQSWSETQTEASGAWRTTCETPSVSVDKDCNIKLHYQPYAGVPGADPEVAAMDALVHALEPLDEAARRRVLEYAASRWVCAAHA